MKFTLGWLKDHLATDASVADIVDGLTRIGIEVEAVIDPGRELAAFTVAQVQAVEPHPNADKLRICTLATAAGSARVVCGAPNVRPGLKGVYAAEGTFIPGAGITLKKTAIRGVESAGMLLSAKEMNLADDHTGIIELPEDAVVGAKAADALGLADTVFDVAITPNRGDCLGVRGLARDLAAAGLGTLKPLAAAAIAGGFASPIGVHLDFEEATASACPRFAGRLVRGVTNGDSPRWLQDRLKAIGLRPISALVDITNYLSFDLCRPLHVFDADKLDGDLHVRLARPGETLAALDGNTYAIDAEMTVIADEAAPQALGGVIGGAASGCTAATRSVFIESALFDPVRTARTGRLLGILSDARVRFERGIDARFLEDGLDIATRMVIELCGGEPSERVVVGATPPARRPIAFRPERIRSLAGIDLPAEQARLILAALGFAVAGDGASWQVTAPPWRNDIDGEACLVEEVARIRGFEHIAPVPLPPQAGGPVAPLSAAQRRRVLARRTLATRGLSEAVTFSFLSARAARAFGGGDATLTLTNPISSDLDVMRPSLLANLVGAAGRNADRGWRDCALFEVGPQYAGTDPAEQSMVAAGIRSGRHAPRHWAQPARVVDAFDAKADALALLAALGLSVDKLAIAREAPAWYHPGRSAVCWLQPGRVLARFGEINPGVLAGLDVGAPVVGFEVFLDALPAAKAGRTAARSALQLAALQPVERDFAFVVDGEVPAAALVDAVRRAEPTLIADVRVFDVFAGGAVAAGKKSIAIAVVLQPRERSLTDAEIEAVGARIVDAVGRATGGALRT